MGIIFLFQSVGTEILCQSAKWWDAWTALDTRCAFANAVYLHSRVYSDKTRELYKRARLAGAMRRGRQGRPPGNWEDAQVTERGLGWA